MHSAALLVFVLATSPMPVVPDEDDAPLSRTGSLSYAFSPTNRVNIADGLTVVTAEESFPTPVRGYAPLRVFIDNSLGPAQSIDLEFRPSGVGSGRTLKMAAQVKAGERRTVVIPVPTQFSNGSLRASGPGLKNSNAAGVYFDRAYGRQRAVLSVSSDEQFEAFVGARPTTSSPELKVATLPVGDVPTEFAALVGYSAIALPNPGTLLELNEAQRQALERYIVSGGRVVMRGDSRELTQFSMFTAPGAVGTSKYDYAYGFGRVTTVSVGTPARSSTFLDDTLLVEPAEVGMNTSRRYYAPYGQEMTPLLPQATAPLGRFLFIIALFTLAIGPGSLWVARRRGPAALLLTIPSTALVTCVLLIGYSLAADGFSIHAASYGYTLLDQKNHRAATLGVTGYYANLSPSGPSFVPGTVLIGAQPEYGEAQGASIDWREGMKLSSDFLSSRVYQEWGQLAVVPTRANLSIKRSGDGWAVQNALGAEIREVRVRLDGVEWSALNVRDGGEKALSRAPVKSLEVELAAKARFKPAVVSTMSVEQDNTFVAVLDGAPFVSEGGLRVEAHDARSVVRGEVQP